jgi:hypothetical protein
MIAGHDTADVDASTVWPAPPTPRATSGELRTSLVYSLSTLDAGHSNPIIILLALIWHRDAQGVHRTRAQGLVPTQVVNQLTLWGEATLDKRRAWLNPIMQRSACTPRASSSRVRVSSPLRPWSRVALICNRRPSDSSSDNVLRASLASCDDGQ